MKIIASSDFWNWAHFSQSFRRLLKSRYSCWRSQDSLFVAFSGSLLRHFLNSSLRDCGLPTVQFDSAATWMMKVLSCYFIPVNRICLRRPCPVKGYPSRTASWDYLEPGSAKHHRMTRRWRRSFYIPWAKVVHFLRSYQELEVAAYPFRAHAWYILGPPSSPRITWWYHCLHWFWNSIRRPPRDHTLESLAKAIGLQAVLLL